MRCVRCKAFGEPETLDVVEVRDIDPAGLAADGVLIDVAATSVNFADILMVQGKYQEKPPFPFTPGLECAGTVRAVGSGVRRVKPGDRVVGLMGNGAYASQAVTRETDTFPIADAMDLDQAAAFGVAYGTAYGGLVWRANLRPGETLVVHGAAGGTGLAAVEVGKALGARVIATASSPEKLAVAREHGADETINYSAEDLRERLKALTDGRGADVFFDPVGGDTFDASLRAINWEGRIVVIGFAGGTIPKAPTNILLVKNVAVLGLYWGAYRKRDPGRVATGFESLRVMAEEGKLNPRISQRFTLDQSAEAMRTLLSRQAIGKVIITT